MHTIEYPLLSQHLNTFLLVDGAKIDDLPRKIAEIDQAVDCWPLYSHSVLSELLNVSPYLIQPRNLQAYQCLLQQSQGKAVVVIQSQSEFKSILAQWQSRIMVNLPDSDEAIFRLHDPDILAVLLSAVNTTPAYQLLGLQQTVYCYCGQQAQWLSFEACSTDENSQVAEQLTLTHQDLAVLSSLQTRHSLQQTAQHICHYFPNMVTDLAQAEQLAERLYRQADKLGFCCEQTLFLFTNIWCHLGSDCLNEQLHPDIAVLLTTPGPKTPLQRIEQAARLAALQPAYASHFATTYLV